jgi:5-(carboxyamino)imidazole ribonucleotide mutase
MSEIKVGIIMGSDSDLPVMQAAADMLEKLQVPFEITIVSAHRTPQRLYDYAQGAEKRGLKVIIAGAGGAAHLPGMVAAISPLPVIGVPVKSSALSGEDSLLSIVQMPPGVPVATVAINGALNAGILAAQILSTSDPELAQRVRDYKAGLEKMVLGKVDNWERNGPSFNR